MVFLVAAFAYVYKAFIEEKPKIAVVLKLSKSQYWSIMESGLEKAFNNFGVNGTIYAPDKTNEDQITILNKVLKEKPDALIYSPVNPAKSIPILKKFKKNHIPVLLVDTGVNWSDQTSFIGTHNLTLGKKSGELLSSILQPGDKVALIGKISNDSVSEDRIQGAKKALNDTGINTVEEYIPFDGDIYSIFSIMDQLHKNNPDIKGVFTSDDEMALEVIKYLNQKGIHLPVIGSDGIIEMIQYIQKGTLKSTIAQNPYDMGYISVENALKAIKGDRVEKKINIGVDIITKDNAESKLQFLKGILK